MIQRWLHLTEGCDFIDSLPSSEMMDIATKYIAKEKEINLLKKALSESNVTEEDKASIFYILEKGGVRTSLNL